MLRIAICDDEKGVARQIDLHALEYSKERGVQLKTQIYLSGESLLKAFDCGEQFSLLFLDIEMKETNGVFVGNYIRNELSNQTMQIVYVSGKESYYKYLFESRPQNFILKPFTKDDIVQEIVKAERILNIIDRQFSFTSKGTGYKVAYSRIKYFSSSNRQIQVHTIDQIYSFYGKLNQLESLKQQGFLRTHNSFFVNSSYIKSWGPASILLTDGSEIPVSKAYRGEVQKEMLKEKG